MSEKERPLLDKRQTNGIIVSNQVEQNYTKKNYLP